MPARGCGVTREFLHPKLSARTGDLGTFGQWYRTSTVPTILSHVFALCTIQYEYGTVLVPLRPAERKLVSYLYKPRQTCKSTVSVQYRYKFLPHPGGANLYHTCTGTVPVRFRYKFLPCPGGANLYHTCTASMVSLQSCPPKNF